MKKTGKTLWRKRIWGGILALSLALTTGILSDGFSTVSHAESQGRVKVSSAKIRSEASTSSPSVGGALQNEVVTITGQVQGGDGYVWYTVTHGGVNGYIRSDLLEVADGNASATPKPTAAPETPAEVTEVNPVSATVTGGTSINIRSNASTTSRSVTKVSSGLALTVTGYANGKDGKVWYRVSFLANNTEVNGFIRSDYATLSGELVPVTSNPGPDVPDPTPEPEPDPTPEPTPQKAWDTIEKEDGWWVYDTATNNGWNILKLSSGAKQNAESYAESQKVVKSQKGVIIVLVILLVGAGAGVAFLVFKIKDMSDSAYFNAVESETLRRRSEAAPGGQRTSRPASAGKQGQRPAGASQSQRPGGASQGQRPSGAAQGQRPSGASQGQRPSGAAQGQRPAGAVQGQRPSGAVQGQRPSGAAQGQRPAGAPQGQRSAGAAKPQPKSGQQSQGWQSKNFIAEDDEEFDFEFLNVDGEEEDR